MKFLRIGVALLVGGASVASGQTRGGVLRGKIVNGTTGAPGRAERVDLIRMASGMEPVAEKETVSGSFVLENVPLAGEAPYLLRITSGGVNYNQPVSFGRGYEAEATITVYDRTKEWKDLTIRTARFLFRRDHDQLRIDKLYVIENKTEPKKTFFAEDGTFKFILPSDMEELLSISASSAGGMPVPQSAVPLSDGSAYVTKTAFKPGTTEIAISYMADYSKGSYAFKDKAFYPLPEVLALVSPPDVKVQAAGLETLNPDPQGRFVVLGAANLKVGDSIDFTLSGGSDHAPDIVAGGNAENTESGGEAHPGGTPQITSLPDPTLPRKWIIALLMAAVLTYGLLTTLVPDTRPSKAAANAAKKK